MNDFRKFAIELIELYEYTDITIAVNNKELVLKAPTQMNSITYLSISKFEDEYRTHVQRYSFDNKCSNMFYMHQREFPIKAFIMGLAREYLSKQDISSLEEK